MSLMDSRTIVHSRESSVSSSDSSSALNASDELREADTLAITAVTNSLCFSNNTLKSDLFLDTLTSGSGYSVFSPSTLRGFPSAPSFRLTLKKTKFSF